MATKKFLDLNGLDYFWGKIKDWVNGLLTGKQDALVSGTNIKTVNNQSLLGSGNIEIQGGDPNAVLFTEQTLTSGQQAQARTNIGAEDASNKVTKISDESTDDQYPSAKCVYDACESLNNDITQLDNKLTRVYKPAGSAASVAALGALTEANLGNVYNMTAAFTTTSDFLEGSGHDYPAGANVAIVSYNDGARAIVYKYDVLSGIVDLSNYVEKSQTAGLLKNNGTVDTTQYGTYSKPSSGIPASDLASGVIPTVPVQDVTVGGTSVVSNGTAVIPQEVFWATYGTTTAAEIDAAVVAGKVVMCVYNSMYYVYSSKIGTAYYFYSITNTTIYWIVLNNTVWQNGSFVAEQSNNKVTSLSSSSTDDQYPSAKCTYDNIHPAIVTTQPVGGFEPNIVYQLGTITGTVTFDMALPSDANITNHYYWTFDTDTTAPTITWPQLITSWFGGSAPTINASKHYEISVLNGIGVAMEV